MSKSVERIKFMAGIAGLAFVGCSVEDSAQLSNIERPGQARQGHEKLIYLPAINSGDTVNPDMFFTVGADPGKPESYGKIISRLDLPDSPIQDGVHHMGYSLDRKRILVSGMFTSNIFVIDVGGEPKRPTLRRTATSLDERSGYIAPHSISPMPNGEVLVSMLGANTESGGPAGLVFLDDKTGEFKRYFGPGPDRSNGEIGADYQYDIIWNNRNHRMLTTTWGWPKNVFGPPWLDGDSVTMWDTDLQRVVQKTVIPADPASGYPTSGATEGDWLHYDGQDVGQEEGYMITDDGRVMRFAEVGTSHNAYDFTTVVSGLGAPCDMTISKDNKYLYVANWFGGADYSGSVQQYDITNTASPRLTSEVAIPHVCMIQLSPDGNRLYATNSVTRVHDDYDWGRISNDQYGLWQLETNPATGNLTHLNADGSPWVKFDNVQKKRNRGPAGVHMILFDPSTDQLIGAH